MSVCTLPQDLATVEPCNVCHTAEHLVWKRWEGTTWWIKCQGCGQLGGTSFNQDTAAQKWNEHVASNRRVFGRAQ